MSVGTYSLTSTPNCRFLRNFCMAVYLLTDFWEIFLWQFIYSQNFARNLLRGIHLRNTFFHISYWCLIWDMNPGFTSNKPTGYLSDYDDFIYFYWQFLKLKQTKNDKKKSKYCQIWSSTLLSLSSTMTSLGGHRFFMPYRTIYLVMRLKLQLNMIINLCNVMTSLARHRYFMP